MSVSIACKEMQEGILAVCNFIIYYSLLQMHCQYSTPVFY